MGGATGSSLIHARSAIRVKPGASAGHEVAHRVDLVELLPAAVVLVEQLFITHQQQEMRAAAFDTRQCR